MIKTLNKPWLTLYKLKNQSHTKLKKKLDRVNLIWIELLKASKPLENSELLECYIHLETIAQKFNVNIKTIRRDLDLLEIDGYIIKHYKTYKGEERDIGNSLYLIINISPQKKTLSSKQKATSLLQKFKNLSTLTI